MIITRSDEVQAYIVEIPELPGYMADGKTLSEAVKNAEIIFREWHETTYPLNRRIPLTAEN
jgi:predicted RNase H-like HicB family nuclease